MYQWLEGVNSLEDANVFEHASGWKVAMNVPIKEPMVGSYQCLVRSQWFVRCQWLEVTNGLKGANGLEGDNGLEGANGLKLPMAWTVLMSWNVPMVASYHWLERF